MTNDSRPTGAPCVGGHRGLDSTEIPNRDVGLLCQGCYRRLRHNVTQLPALVGWLHAHIAATSSSALDDQHVSGSHDAPIPLRLDVLDLIGPYAADPGLIDRAVFLEQEGDPTIGDMVGSWSLLVNEEAGFPLPDQRNLTSLVDYLATNLLWVAAQPWVDEFYEEVASMVRRAAQVAPWQPERRRVKDEACDACGMAALVTHVADGVTVCERRLGGCGKRRHISDYMLKARGREAS